MNVKIETTNVCLVCNGKKLHYDFSINKYRVEECSSCGMMRLNPQPTDQELAAIYNENYFLINSNDKAGQEIVSKLKSSTAQHYLSLLEAYIGSPLRGHLLEIGCGHGDFLATAADLGLKVTGIEYSPHSAKVATDKLKNKGRVLSGEIDQLVNSNEQFDFIVFADVLEHVRSPRQFLKTAYSLLKKDGIAVAIVPSIDSLSARLMNNKWMEFKPEHLWYFSRRTLKRLLYSEGFGEVKINKAKKTLNFDYVTEHFARYPVQPFTSVLSLFKQFLPNFLRKLPIRLDAGGIITISRKKRVSVSKKLSIVMAVYNEEKTLKKILDRVLEKTISNVEIELVVVESKSTDNTRSVLKEYEGKDRVKIIYQDQASGKGNAIRMGFQHVSGDIILIQDADDEYDVEDYNVLIEPILNGEAEFVLGARHGGRAWKMRQFSDQKFTGHLLNLGHWFFTLLINIFYGVRLKDPFTMYKVFRTDCLRNLKFECNRFDFDCELLIKLVRSGYKPLEVPVNYRSRSFKEGKKVRVFRDPFTWLTAIVKYRLQKI